MATAKHCDRERHQRCAGGRKRGNAQPAAADAENGRQVRFGRFDLREDRLGMISKRRAGGVPISASSRAMACETADCV
jgi:hypothetical protein